MGRRQREQEALRRAMCVGKHAMDRVTARTVAERMRRRRDHKEQVRAYRCRFCHEWHVGSQVAAPVRA